MNRKKIRNIKQIYCEYEKRKKNEETQKNENIFFINIYIFTNQNFCAEHFEDENIFCDFFLFRSNDRVLW